VKISISLALLFMLIVLSHAHKMSESSQVLPDCNYSRSRNGGLTCGAGAAA
jgi:hypothetical protein